MIRGNLNQMMPMTQITKVAIFVSLLAIAVVSGWIYYLNHEKKAPLIEERIALVCFQSKSGWGYRININNKTYIYQPIIPVIATEKGFPSEETAEKTGEIVVGKLKNHEPPILTLADLQSTGAVKK